MRLHTEELAGLIEAKTKEGLSLAEAISSLNIEIIAKSERPKVEDRIAYIQSLTDINEVRKATKSAYAKMSKATSEEAEVRYDHELKVARDRLRELNQMIDKAENPLVKALELGEDPAGVVQRSLDLFSTLNSRLLKYLRRVRMTQKQAKELMRAIPDDKIASEIINLYKALSDEEPNPYLEVYKERMRKSDQRVLTLNKMLIFLEDKAI